VIKLSLLSPLCLASDLKCAESFAYLNSLLAKPVGLNVQVTGSSNLLITKQQSVLKIQLVEGKELTSQELRLINISELKCHHRLPGKPIEK